MMHSLLMTKNRKKWESLSCGDTPSQRVQHPINTTQQTPAGEVLGVSIKTKVYERPQNQEMDIEMMDETPGALSESASSSLPMNTEEAVEIV